MITPTSGPIDLLANTGSEALPTPAGAGGFPQALEVSRADMMHSLNPLQYVPVVGMIYRQATGEQIPSTARVIGAGLLGGPLGMIGAALGGLLEELMRMGPDLSRPATPAGMAQTGSESGVEPTTPGSLPQGAYTTLATTTPDFLAAPANTAIVQNGTAAYQSASMEYLRSQAVEKGLV